VSDARAAGLRRLAVLVGCLLAAGLAAVLTLAPSARPQAGGSPRALPLLGPADAEMVLMGAGTQSEESWGYRRLPLDVPPPVVDGRRLAFGPLPEGREAPQLAFLRHVDARGWQVADVPLDAEGAPYRGPSPNPQSPSITPRGGGLLIGRDNLRPTEDQLVLLTRDPEGRWQERRLPDEELPEEGGVLGEGEAIAGDRGQGRVAAAAFDRDGRTGAYLGVVGGRVEDAIVRFDGTTFTREPVVVPPDTQGARILAIDAATETDAFALVETADDEGRGVELYERVGAGPAATWVERDLGDTLFADRAVADRGLSDIEPLAGGADPLTVTTDGAWVDGSLLARATADADPVEADFTLFYDAGAEPDGRVTGTWCDAADAAGDRVCEHDLGAAFDRGNGYRSFAFPGSGFGTRVITNPLEPGGDEASNRGTYLRLDGTTFTRRRGDTGNRRPSGAFRSADRGWLEGPIEIGAGERPDRLARWPVAVRSTLTAADALARRAAGRAGGGRAGRRRRRRGGPARRRPGLAARVPAHGQRQRGPAAAARRRVAGGPIGRTPSATSERCGSGARTPGCGSAIRPRRSGSRRTCSTSPSRPAAPTGASRSAAPARCCATTRRGRRRRCRPDSRRPDLTSVTFAGDQALAAVGADLLVNDGAGWRVDEGLRGLLDVVRRGRPQVRVVRGLPDGGAVAAGRSFVVVRDGAGGPWRFVDQPLPGQTIVAAAPLRAGDRVRALVATQPRLAYPQLDDPVQVDPDVPPPILPASRCRATATCCSRPRRAGATSGARRTRRRRSTARSRATRSRARRRRRRRGWAIGGWGGDPTSPGRGTRVARTARASDTRRLTAPAPRGAPPGRRGGAPDAPVPQPAGPVRLAVGGIRRCENPCAGARRPGPAAPDRCWRAGDRPRRAHGAGPHGREAFSEHHGGVAAARRATARCRRARRRRYGAGWLARPGRAAVYSAVSAADSAGAAPAAAFTAELSSLPAPFGTGACPSASPPTACRASTRRQARGTHYALRRRAGRAARAVVVIDNFARVARTQRPASEPKESQLPWLKAVLGDAKARGIASVVVGSRDLSRFTPRLNVAEDGDEVAQALVDGGASAYFYERPEENRAVRIPSGGATQIPAYGTARSATARRWSRPPARTCRCRASATGRCCSPRSTRPSATRRPTARRSPSARSRSSTTCRCRPPTARCCAAAAPRCSRAWGAARRRATAGASRRGDRPEPARRRPVHAVPRRAVRVGRLRARG
jgi:hypothetical protein